MANLFERGATYDDVGRTLVANSTVNQAMFLQWTNNAVSYGNILSAMWDGDDSTYFESWHLDGGHSTWNLGETALIKSINVYYDLHSETAGKTFDTFLQYSTDGTNWTTLQTTNNTDSAAVQVSYVGGAFRAKYIRWYMTPDASNFHAVLKIMEFFIYV